jgi:hypothetical protein
MSSIIGRSAFRATQRLYSAPAISQEQRQSAQAIKVQAKKNPELYV